MTDLELLQEALDRDDLNEDARSRFLDMVDKLDEHPLSPKQRAWLEASVAGERYEPEDAPVPASAFPRGKEVPAPPVLQNLPLKPPTRVR